MKYLTLITPLFFALLVCAGNAGATSSTDYYLQNDRVSIEDENPEGLLDHYQEYINWLFAQGYSPTSILLSSVNRGLTVADVVSMMSRSVPENAKEFATIAETLLPSLPGWVCSNSNAIGHRYDKPINRESLSGESSLAEVASLYFEENERFKKLPDWQNGAGHIDASLDELLDFKKLEIDYASSDSDPVDSWWYLKDQVNSNDVIVVGLFPEDERIVIDARLGELQALRENGVAKVPVMFMYNEFDHIPMSDVERVPNEVYGGSSMKGDEFDYIDGDDGEITVSEVISRFESSGDMIPPARDWKFGDHHLQVRTEELHEVFDVPEKEDIDPVLWQKAVERLSQHPKDPLHISLYKDAEEGRWLDNASVVAVAKEQDLDRLPVAFFFHGMERQACGLPSVCISDIKAAAISGSGNPELFGPPATDVPPSGGEPPVIVPPGDGPISPN